MQRRVEPEILDHLDPRDPAAIASRADLRRLNGIMGHASILTRAARIHLSDADLDHPLEIVELGGGDGTMLLRLARRWSALGVAARVRLVDRGDLLSSETLREFADLGWSVESIQEEAVHWMRQSEGKFDLLIANLFLHHFEPADLRSIFESASQRVRVLLACEPRRNRFAWCASRLVGLLGCNSVTRNDATISVRAGFEGDELTRLWPSIEDWRLIERRAGLFSHLFAAVRR